MPERCDETGEGVAQSRPDDSTEVSATSTLHFAATHEGSVRTISRRRILSAIRTSVDCSFHILKPLSSTCLRSRVRANSRTCSARDGERFHASAPTLPPAKHFLVPIGTGIRAHLLFHRS